MTTTEFIEDIKNCIMAELLPLANRIVEEKYADRIKRATLSTEEAANYIGVSKTLLHEMAKRKEIPWFPVGVSGSAKPQRRFRLSSLDRWMDEQEKNNYKLKIKE